MFFVEEASGDRDKPLTFGTQFCFNVCSAKPIDLKNASVIFEFTEYVATPESFIDQCRLSDSSQSIEGVCNAGLCGEVRVLKGLSEPPKQDGLTLEYPLTYFLDTIRGRNAYLDNFKLEFVVAFATNYSGKCVARLQVEPVSEKQPREERGCFVRVNKYYTGETTYGIRNLPILFLESLLVKNVIVDKVDIETRFAVNLMTMETLDTPLKLTFCPTTKSTDSWNEVKIEQVYDIVDLFIEPSEPKKQFYVAIISRP
jgi:hypothetical protein